MVRALTRAQPCDPAPFIPGERNRVEITGERQVAPTLDGIRADHVARYQWAVGKIAANSRVVDFACGVGYGSQILAEAGHNVTGYDQSPEALQYARTFYPKAEYRQADGVCPLKVFDVAVCFETIEHVDDPLTLLESFSGAKTLLASVPNEDVVPFGDGFAFHHRHYTRDEFAELLTEAGWSAVEWWGQKGAESDVERDVNGRTLIAVCERAREKPIVTRTTRVVAEDPTKGWPVPDHVAILGLGPSLEAYVDTVKRLGGKHAFCDETWGINAVAGVVICDRVFHMDDVVVQERRAEAAPQSNIARMVEWLKIHPGPVYTSRSYPERAPDYEGLVDYPLETVLNGFPCATGYFNSTAAYAVAYAIHIGVKKISLFGFDFSYPNAHQAEKGRACVEYWLGVASERGIRLTIAKQSTLMDAIHTQAERFYGYDTLDLTIRNDNGQARIDFVPKEESAIPTADVMERRYCHDRHPNALVEASER